jgi:hypothetical protein
LLEQRSRAFEVAEDPVKVALAGVVHQLFNTAACQAASPNGLQATARELRARAREMADSNDREAILRLAAGYGQRANDALRRLRR